MMDCVQEHPKSAFDAWKQIIEVDVSTLPKYLPDWQATPVFQGLYQSTRIPNTIQRPSNVVQLTAVRDQFLVDEVLHKFPTEAEFKKAQCVSGAGPNLLKDDLKQLNTSCGFLKECYTPNDAGELEVASKVAKRVAAKEGKAHVARGVCLARPTAANINRRNKKHFTNEIQQYEDRIRELELQQRQFLKLDEPSIVNCVRRQ